jgi:ubiquinol-cytochrome c reductase cytochrome b subunit
VIPRPRPTDDAVRFVDDRLGASKFAKKALRYIFPDHWSFMLGEIALYCFVVLVATGIFLAFFFSPSDGDVVYRGTYEPLRGAEVSEAYGSVVNLSFDVPAGLLMRQVHHWAADVFVVAIVLHLLRVFFTAAFRKPRDVNYYVGVTMLGLALLEGFLGYSLVDDLLSGMGLAIAYSVLMSVPLIGDRLTVLVWGDAWPGSPELWPRMFIAHVLIIPLVFAALISLHLAMIMRHHHTQFRGPRRTEHNVVGTPLWPAYALRSLGLACAVVAVLLLLGGLVQINPIWQWGPYHTADATNGAQPDWYLGWLIGGLRLVPGWEPVIGGFTLIPNPFWGGVFFPTVVFAILYAWPWLDRRRERDREHHHLLDLPRENPRRTALGAALFAWVAIVFFIGSFDRIYFLLGIPYEGQIWFWRFGIVLVPVLVYFATRRVTTELALGRARVLRGFYGEAVRRAPGGGFEVLPPAGEAPSVEAPSGVTGVTDTELGRVINALTATLNDQRPDRLDRQRLQSLVTETLGGEEKLTVVPPRVLDDRGEEVAAIRFEDGAWTVERTAPPRDQLPLGAREPTGGEKARARVRGLWRRLRP